MTVGKLRPGAGAYKRVIIFLRPAGVGGVRDTDCKGGKFKRLGERD